MNTAIKYLRWLLLIVIVVLIFFATLLTIPFSATSNLITDRQKPLTWIKEAGVYEDSKEIVLAVTANNADQSPFAAQMRERLSNPNDELTKQFDKLASPIMLERNVTNFVNGLYDWMEGKSDQPTFRLELVGEKQEFVDLLSVLFKEKVRGLPECDGSQPIPTGEDPLNMRCLPPGFDLNQVDLYLQQNSDNPMLQEFFDKSKTEQTIQIEPEAQRTILNIHRVARYFPVVSILMLIVLVGLAVLIAPNRTLGLKISAAFIFLAGIVSLIGSFLFKNSYEGVVSFITSRMQAENLANVEILREKVVGVGGMVYTDLIAGISHWAAGYILVGLLVFVGITLFGMRKRDSESVT